MSDALISRENYDDIRAEQIRAVQGNQEAVRLARMRYMEGLSSYVEVLDALQRLYPAQLSLAQTEVNRRLVVVQLYKALGGGWNLTDQQFTTAGALPGGQSPRAGNQPWNLPSAFGAEGSKALIWMRYARFSGSEPAF